MDIVLETQKIVAAVYLRDKNRLVDMIMEMSEDEVKEILTLLNHTEKAVGALKLIEILFAMDEDNG
jgi:hypothetical protein